MRGRNLFRRLVALLLLWGVIGAALLVATIVGPFSVVDAEGRTRVLELEARSFAFSPGRVEVSVGDRVTIRLRSTDVTHGLYVDRYGASVVAEPGRPAEVTFVADRAGRFRLRCSVACGALHPFMLGELVVRPQRLVPAALGLTVLASGGLIAAISLGWRPSVGRQGRRSWTLDRWPLLGSILRSRFFPWGLRVVTLAILLAVIVAGFWGTPVGSRNLAIVFVWILWWGMLVLLLLPLGGRAWCAICPLPMPGEWLSRGGLLRVPLQRSSTRPRRRWPRFLRNIWLQNAIFLGLATFSALILTRPSLTAYALLGFLVLATVIGLFFPRRAFCRYLCPMGGFIGLYALAAPLQLRVRDRDLCRAHREKECLRGSQRGYGCPWGVYPGNLGRNSGCGLCTECLKTCPLDNVTLRLRRPGAGLLARARMDEAFKSLIMLAAALLYSGVLLGPWGWLKDLAGQPLQPRFLLYVAGLWGGGLLLLPALFGGVTALGRRLGDLRKAVSLRQHFVQSAYALIPLGLGAWMAFTLSFVPANLSYVWNVLSDPLGRGWNLLGGRDAPWTPLLTSVVPYLQVAVLLLGVLAAIAVAVEVARRAGAASRRAALAALPVALFAVAVAAILLRLYQG